MLETDFKIICMPKMSSIGPVVFAWFIIKHVHVTDTTQFLDISIDILLAKTEIPSFLSKFRRDRWRYGLSPILFIIAIKEAPQKVIEMDLGVKVWTKVNI